MKALWGFILNFEQIMYILSGQMFAKGLEVCFKQ